MTDRTESSSIICKINTTQTPKMAKEKKTSAPIGTWEVKIETDRPTDQPTNLQTRRPTDGHEGL